MNKSMTAYHADGLRKVSDLVATGEAVNIGYVCHK